MKNNLQIITKLFSHEEPLILALSGGRDSMTLLDLLQKANYKVIVCHVNHQKRKESLVEEKYIKEFCLKNNIPCEIAHFNFTDNSNFQAEAHNFRYDFFYKTAKKYNSKYILTAHQANDLAETCLMRLISGSNLYGYGGISFLVPYKDIFICRPLLKVSRMEIDRYVKENNIFFFEDYTNSLDDYLRNRIRHNILPLFVKENPNFYQNIANYSKILKESFAYIREGSISFLADKLEFQVDKYLQLNIALQKDILSYILEQYKIKASYKIIEDLIKVIKSQKPQLDYYLKDNYFLSKRYNLVKIEKRSMTKYDSIELSIRQKVNFLDKYTFYLTENISNINAKYIKICYNKLDFPIKIRTRLPGDYLVFKFGKKKLKDYFIDKKIPKEKRDNYPLIIDSNNQIIAIFGLLNLSKGDKYIYLVCEVKDA